MPTKIYLEENPHIEFAFLCEDSWDLEKQIDALKSWVKSRKKSLEFRLTIADVGFVHRKEAMGGGPVLEHDFLLEMGTQKISLFLSEYPSQ